MFVPQQSLLRVLHFDCNFLSCHTAVRSGKVGTHCHPNLLAGEDWNSPEMWKTSGCGADCHGSFGTAASGISHGSCVIVEAGRGHPEEGEWGALAGL